MTTCVGAMFGGKEVSEQTVSYRRRDTMEDNSFSRDVLSATIDELLVSIQQTMLEQMQTYRDENTRTATTYEEFTALMADHKGFVKVHWNDNAEIEEKIKAETKASSRCRLEESSDGVDFYTGEPASSVWLFAQSY